MTRHRVLAISDTHAPCMREDAIDFLRDLYKQWQCTKVVHIGDVVDWHCINYHEKDLKNINFAEEFQEAKRQVHLLTKAFPKVEVMTGNHDALPHRRACTAGLPGVVIKGNHEIWETPKGWNWNPRYSTIDIDGVLYRHGDSGKGGAFPALANAIELFQPVIQGHFHASAGVKYHANPSKLVFGGQTGCLTDWEHAQQEYGVKFNKKPILGAMVCIEGKQAYFEPMAV